MNQTEKKGIQASLAAYVKKMGGANPAANKLSGVSSATISQVANNNWELISDAMWLKIGKQTGYYAAPWVVAETSVKSKIFAYLGDAQRQPNGIRSLIAKSSLGKSVSIAAYIKEKENCYLINCHKNVSFRILIRNLLRAMGKDSSGTTVEMMENLVMHIQRAEQPLIIINEVDKLKDEVLEMFVDLENELHQQCGIAFFATPFFTKRMMTGVARGKRGYAELHSRCRKIYWDLSPSRNEFTTDVIAICTANGITDKQVITELHNKCEEDFRVLADLINAYLASQKTANQ